MLAIAGLMTGLLQVGFGAVGLGRLIKYMPYPVVSGYLSGVGLVIIIQQVPKLLGAPKGMGLIDGTRRAGGVAMARHRGRRGDHRRRAGRAEGDQGDARHDRRPAGRRGGLLPAGVERPFAAGAGGQLRPCSARSAAAACWTASPRALPPPAACMRHSCVARGAGADAGGVAVHRHAEDLRGGRCDHADAAQLQPRAAGAGHRQHRRHASSAACRAPGRWARPS